MGTVFKTLKTPCETRCAVSVCGTSGQVGPKSNKEWSDSDMTQHQPGLGWLPQQAILRILPQGKILKIGKCVYTCPACRLVNMAWFTKKAGRTGWAQREAVL